MEEGYPDKSLPSIPGRAVCVRKCAKSSSEVANRLSQGPAMDTQLQACGRDSLGSMNPYVYSGCVRDPEAAEDRELEWRA